MQLPAARGPLSGGVIDALAGRADLDVEAVLDHVRDLPEDTDLLTDDDLHLALWVLYELHYGGFDGVDADREWDPDLLRVRAALERSFEAELRRRAERHVVATLAGHGDLADRLFDLSATFEGPSVARYLHREAGLDQLVEFLSRKLDQDYGLSPDRRELSGVASRAKEWFESNWADTRT